MKSRKKKSTFKGKLKGTDKKTENGSKRTGNKQMKKKVPLERRVAVTKNRNQGKCKLFTHQVDLSAVLSHSHTREEQVTFEERRVGFQNKTGRREKNP